MRSPLGRTHTLTSATDVASHAQVYPMFAFLKDCFSKPASRRTFHLTLNRWRSVMQVLVKSRHPQATLLRVLTERLQESTP